MLWNLGPGWLLMAVAVVAILSFIVALGLNATMGEDGFGATGNAVIITAGFFLAIIAANMLGYRLSDMRFATVTGMCGGFACLAALTFGKALASRL
ncbi:hypothetical protein [Mesorhizobium sp. CAU 1741]|uniref:hypothetical protein n=1 Tax=Mesorhizobium sp. CAU 1741 TaxID=3140366 RepID=UPI00325A71DA